MSSNHNNNKLELFRKIFHIVSISLWIIPINIFPKYINIFIFSFVILLNFLLTQRYQLLILKPLYVLVNYIEREKNMKTPGIQGLWANVGIFLTYLLFDENITTAAVLILAVSDGMSGIVGYYLGRIKIPFGGGKTFEGTLVFFVSSFILTYIFFDVKSACFISVVVTAVELFLRFPDDNFTVPLSVGFSFLILQLI